MTPIEIETTVKALLAQVPALQKAGVTRLELDGCAIDIGPAVPDFDAEEFEQDPHDGRLDPLADPSTFGGDRVPSFLPPDIAERIQGD